MTNQERLAAALADRYAIEHEIGSGGMATVHLAHDLKHDRKVAVKVLRPELASELGAERFVREIRMAARLTHPHILPLFDSGEAGGFLYFVMPLLEGESLRTRIEDAKQLGVDEAVQVAREIADALDYAHRHDVVHRDIKPENIMIHDGHAVVADFGIGKAVTAAAQGTSTLTQTGVTVGTPAYMAPEQASGETEIDGRADLYALGCVLYEMLTGEQPFTGATAQAVIAKRFAYTPPPVTQSRDAVPQGLSNAIERLMGRMPADRYATGAQAVDALKSGERAALAFSDADEKSIAVLPFANLSTDSENEFFADGITEEIINALSQLSELRVAARTSSFAFKGRNTDLFEVATKLRVAHVVEGSVRKSGNRIRITAQLVSVKDGSNTWSEKYDRVIDDIFEVQDEIAGAIAERMKVALGKRQSGALVKPSTTNLEAYELYLKGRAALYRRSGSSLLEGRRLFEQALQLDEDYALALAGLSDAMLLLDFYGLRQESLGDVARGTAARALDIDPNLAEAHNSVGATSCLFGWDWDGGEASFLRALELNPGYVQARCWWAIVSLCSVKGRIADAVAETEKAIELDPLAAYPRSILSWILAAGQRNEEAVGAAREGMERDPGSLLPVVIRTLAVARCGRTDEALELAERAVLSFGRNTWALANLVLAHFRAGDEDRAGLVCDELHARAQYENIPAFQLATGYAAAGRVDEAFAALDRGCETRDTTMFQIRLLEPDLFWDDPRLAAVFERVGLASIER